MPSPAGRSAQLLHADEDQLDRAAIALRSGTAFVVAVCPGELRKAAMERLRGRVTGLALPDPLEVGSAEESMVALIEQVQRRDRVLSLVLGRDVMGALDGLNLHREKVVRGGPVILWLEDVAALLKMRERAPDAFSFRATMVVVRGDGGAVAPTKGEEPEALTNARKRLRRARATWERASAGYRLADVLRAHLRMDEAEEVARGALLSLPVATSDDQHAVRAGLFRSLAIVEKSRQKTIQERRWIGLGFAEIDAMSWAHALPLRARLLARCPGPFRGHDRSSVEGALRLVRDYGLAPELRAVVLHSMVMVALEMGDVGRARQLSGEASSIKVESKLDGAKGLLREGRIEEATGKLLAAEDKYREADALAVAGAAFESVGFAPLAYCLAVRGEIEAAVRTFSGGVGSGAEIKNEHMSAVVALLRGDVEASLIAIRSATFKASSMLRDDRLYNECHTFAYISIEANEAGSLLPAQMVPIRADLEDAGNLLLSLSGPDGPPWYPIELLTLRARVLALTSDTILQALDLARQALDLARSTYPDLLPETGRSLADHLLLAAQPDEALAVVADVEPYASENGFLAERARLLADRVLALVQRGDAPATIEPHLTSLRAALAATDSPRITAETLRDLAIRLPPGATTPDPLALAEEIHPLFVAMPMPAEDARCLELMGDVLLARGRPDEAKRRYLTARARLQRYGLGLRLPLLNRKIDALP